MWTRACVFRSKHFKQSNYYNRFRIISSAPVYTLRKTICTVLCNTLEGALNGLLSSHLKPVSTSEFFRTKRIFSFVSAELSPFSTRRIYSCERKTHQRDWLAKTFAFSSTNHVAEFCVRAYKFA